MKEKLQILGVLVFILTMFFFAMGRGILVNEKKAVNAMTDQGFSEVQVIEKDWFAIGYRGGSDDDVARFTVEATNSAGNRVTMHVFCGWPFKGATVRSID